MNSFDESLKEADLLCRYQKLAAAASSDDELRNVLEQAFDAEGLYVFGEFFDIGRVAGNAALMAKLSLFAYGRYKDIDEAVKKGAAPLTEKQVKKMRQLTLASLVHDTHKKIIPFDLIKKELGVTVVRELEDIIIDAMYHKIVEGKLDHEKETFTIEKFLGRDVNKSEIEDILSVMQGWFVSRDPFFHVFIISVFFVHYFWLFLFDFAIMIFFVGMNYFLL